MTVHAGRPAKLGRLQRDQVADLFNAGRHSADEIGRMFEVSAATVYRAVTRADRELLGRDTVAAQRRP